MKEYIQDVSRFTGVPKDKIVKAALEDLEVYLFSAVNISDLSKVVMNDGTETIFYKSEPIVQFLPLEIYAEEKNNEFTVKYVQSYKVYTKSKANPNAQ